MFSKKKRKAVSIFWLIFGIIMILAMVGFLLTPLLAVPRY